VARGGKREGAGRKTGSLTTKTQEIAAKAAEGGELPVDYMLRVMRDRTVDNGRRDDMAKAVAPYVHPKLAAVEHTGKDGGPLQVSVVRFTDG
jgi:hypothetical protein